MNKRRHKVHVYAIFRVEFWVDDEKTPEAAAERVMADPATHERLHQLKGPDFEFAEDWEVEAVVGTYEGDELMGYADVSIRDADGNL